MGEETEKVKEGGKVYRPATVIKFDEGIGALDLEYNDGEKECGVPVNLIRAVSGGAGVSANIAAPPGMHASPSTVSEEPALETAGNLRRREKNEENIARQCYALVKSFAPEEQEAAMKMLLAFDSVRAGKS